MSCFYNGNIQRDDACPQCGAGPKQPCRATDGGVKATTVEADPAFPCHAKPRAEWCDRDGPGGFMGHTCTVVPAAPKAPLCTPKEFIEELLFQIQADAAASVQVRADARISELLEANNREVAFRRHGFTVATLLAAYLESLLRSRPMHGLNNLPDVLLRDPTKKHPFADFELEHIAALIKYARAPFGPNPLKPQESSK